MIASKGLDYFFVVARLGSIRAASIQLRISPSAISRQIAALEDEIGLELAVRHARGLHLTEAGKIFYSYVKRTKSEEDFLKETLSDLRGLKIGSVSVIAGDGFGHNFITEVLPDFQSRFPTIRTDISFGGTDYIIRAISDDDWDRGG
jgi:DNA-binding transcriptional LysR family regulator